MTNSSITLGSPAIATGSSTVSAIAGGWADICIGPTPGTDTDSATGDVNLTGMGCWGPVHDNEDCKTEATGVLVEDDSYFYTLGVDNNPGLNCGEGIRINGGIWGPGRKSQQNLLAPYIDNCEANLPGNVIYSNYGAQLPRNSNINNMGNANLAFGTNWNIGPGFDLWVLNRSGPTSAFTDTFTDTASAIIAQLPGAATGQCYHMQYNNLAGGSATLAKTGTGVTLSPASPTISAGEVSYLRLCITNLSTHTVTIFQDH